VTSFAPIKPNQLAIAFWSLNTNQCATKSVDLSQTNDVANGSAPDPFGGDDL